MQHHLTPSISQTCSRRLLLEALNPSLEGGRDARYGSGQYLTDIVPGTMLRGRLARRLHGQPWAGNRLDRFLEIDVSELNVQNPAPNIFLIPGELPLDLTGRILSHGTLE